LSTTLGIKIRKARKEGKFTLDALAKDAGLSKSYLWELENRDESQTPNPSAEKLVALAGALNLSVNYFLDNEVLSPEEKHIDEGFFRGYKQLDPTGKEQLRKVLEAFKKK